MHARAGELPPERTRPTIPNWPTGPADQPDQPTPPRLPLVVEPLATSLDEALLQRRVVAVTGNLDAQLATDTAARLLHLDATAEGSITVRLDCGTAEVGAALVLVDTFGSLRAQLHLVVVGQAAGAAVVVVAAAHSSSIYPHARIVLTEPDVPAIEGDAAHVDALLSEQRRLLAAAYDVIAQRCGKPRDEIERDMLQRRLLTAADAVDYGIVDRIE